MSQEKPFYVYVHRYASGPKQGEVFYVGKGSGDRFKNVGKRNKHWRNIVSKYGFYAEIVIHFNTEVCAFSFEISIISYYGIENLCNLTSGGEGSKGYKWTEEQKDRARAASTGRKHTPETIRKMKEYQSEFHPMKGRKHSDKTKKLLSKQRKGKKQTNFYFYSFLV